MLCEKLQQWRVGYKISALLPILCTNKRAQSQCKAVLQCRANVHMTSHNHTPYNNSIQAPAKYANNRHNTPPGEIASGKRVEAYKRQQKTIGSKTNTHSLSLSLTKAHLAGIIFSVVMSFCHFPPLQFRPRGGRFPSHDGNLVRTVSANTRSRWLSSSKSTPESK